MGVRVNCVAPAFIGKEHYGPEEFADALHRTPTRRVGNPEEIAAVIELLASEEADYLLGTVVVVDGGRSLYQFPEE